MLGWTQKKLAQVSVVSVSTVQSFENLSRETHSSAIQKLETAFQSAGIRFVETENPKSFEESGRSIVMGCAK